MYIFANFDKHIQLCNYHHNQEFNKPITPQIPLCLLCNHPPHQSQPSPFSKDPFLFNFFSLPFPKCHIDGIIIYSLLNLASFAQHNAFGVYYIWHVSVVCAFLLLINSNPLYGCTRLFIHSQWRNVWLVSRLGSL